MRQALYIQRQALCLASKTVRAVLFNTLHNEVSAKSTWTWISSGNSFNLREVVYGYRVAIAAVSIQSEKGVFPCHTTASVTAGGSNGKIVTALYIFKIWLCICELRGYSLYAIGRVFDNPTVQSGRKRAECIGAEDRTVQGCDSGAWFDISCLPWHQPCSSHPLFVSRGSL